MKLRWQVIQGFVSKALMVLGLIPVGFFLYCIYDLVTFENDPAHFTKDIAASVAMKKLVQFSEQNNVPLYQFCGPYFDESIGLSFPTYDVCFQSPTHFFCHDHWTGHQHSGKALADPTAYRKAAEELQQARWHSSNEAQFSRNVSKE